MALLRMIGPAWLHATSSTGTLKTLYFSLIKSMSIDLKQAHVYRRGGGCRFSLEKTLRCDEETRLSLNECFSYAKTQSICNYSSADCALKLHI